MKSKALLGKCFGLRCGVMIRGGIDANRFYYTQVCGEMQVGLFYGEIGRIVSVLPRYDRDAKLLNRGFSRIERITGFLPQWIDWDASIIGIRRWSPSLNMFYQLSLSLSIYNNIKCPE